MSIQIISYYQTLALYFLKECIFSNNQSALFSICGNNDKSNTDCKLLLIFVAKTASAPHWMSLIALLGIYVHELPCTFWI